MESDTGIDKDTALGRRSECPLACALDLIGDKWTLLVIRDMLFFGKTQFGEFLRSDEGISTNILAERLKRLERHGLVVKHPYQTHPPRYAYALTRRGEGLRPVLGELVKWSRDCISDTEVGP